MTTTRVDAVAQAIRTADGDHTMGAGALAEVIVRVLAELIARDIEAESDRRDLEGRDAIAFRIAARIAREVTP